MALRIAFASYFYPGIEPYGASVYTQKMLLILSKSQDVSVDFYCPYPVRNFKKVPRINYIYIPFQRITAFRYVSYSFNLARLVKLNGPYDIVHSNLGGTLFLKKI